MPSPLPVVSPYQWPVPMVGRRANRVRCEWAGADGGEAGQRGEVWNGPFRLAGQRGEACRAAASEPPGALLASQPPGALPRLPCRWVVQGAGGGVGAARSARVV
jgi:hypothetical protein